MPSISAVIIAKDEERNIADCLKALAFCDERVVVDSGSRDRTVEAARNSGASVFEKPFTDFASQKNFAISKARGEWVLLVDADERVTPELAAEIRKTVEAAAAGGYFVTRQNRIFGRWMRHGGNAGDRQLRLVRRDKAVFEGLVHERVRIAAEKTGRLKNPLRHFSTATVGEYMPKLNHYTSLEARVLAERGEAADEKKMKTHPLMLFVYLHFAKAGFLDGMEGFLFNALSAYYEFVRRAKRWELSARERKDR